LQFLSLDETELGNLAAAGLTPDSVLPSGTRVFLRETASAASGAESFDVTEQVHPETEKLALDAVGLVGLDIAGLDIIADDISQPLSAQHGAFLEINEQPGIFMHAAPLCSPPRPVGEAIVESLFPGGHKGRIPLVVVIGRQVADSVARWLADTLANTGRVVGLSTPEATQLNGRLFMPASSELPDRLSVLLRHPRTEMAVVSAPLEDVLHSGLGTDRCTVLVLLDGLHSSSGNGQSGSRRDIDRLLERLLRSATRCVVNAADPLWQNI
jgi:cyanophycin synthetase